MWKETSHKDRGAGKKRNQVAKMVETEKRCVFSWDLKREKLAVGREGREDNKESETDKGGERAARPLRSTGKEFQRWGAT